MLLLAVWTERFAYSISSLVIVWERSQQRPEQVVSCPCTSLTKGESDDSHELDYFFSYYTIFLSAISSLILYFFSLMFLSILVNTIYSVKLFQFAKVFWDYASSSRGDHCDVMPQDSLVSEKSAASLRKFPLSAPAGDHVAQLPSTIQKIHSHNCMKPERGERLHRTHILSSLIKCQIQRKHAQGGRKNIL